VAGTKRHPRRHVRRTAWSNSVADDTLSLYASLRDGPACGHPIFGRGDRPPCAKCASWWSLHDRFHTRLDLGPYHWPAFLPAGTTKAVEMAEQRALADEFDAALDAAEAASSERVGAFNGLPIR
jgi:hypothetical protein